MHLVEESDLKYYWAAYKKGAFDLPVDLAQEAFTEQITTLAQAVPTYTLISEHPIGMATVNHFHDFAWPSVTWFSWATPRQIVETSVYALQEGLRDTTLMFIVDSASFSTHMARYGLLSRVGKLTDGRKMYERRKW